MQIHITEKAYLCEDCISTFSQRSSLIFHVKIHHGEQEYPGALCESSFRKVSYYIIFKHTLEKNHNSLRIEVWHFQTSQLCCATCKHAGDKPYSCKICTPEFLKKSTCEHTRVINSSHMNMFLKFSFKYKHDNVQKIALKAQT